MNTEKSSLNRSGINLSVIIPWSNRPELQETLIHNCSLFETEDVEIIIVNCGGNNMELQEITSNVSFESLSWIEIPNVPFNKSLALNIGVHSARANSLFFLDADIFLKEDPFPATLKLLQNHCFVTVDRVFESRPKKSALKGQLQELAYSIELVDQILGPARLETNRLRLYDGSRSAPGLVLLKKGHFLAVDGMNSALQGWGWEDLDLLARLQFVLGLSWQRSGDAIHMTHGDEVRYFSGPTRQVNEASNFATCLSNYNQGNFTGTYTDDIGLWHSKVVTHFT